MIHEPRSYDSWSVEQQRMLDSLSRMKETEAIAVVSAFLARQNDSYMEQHGYERAEKGKETLRHAIWELHKRGSGESWDDHGVPLRMSDGRQAYLCEPYGVGLDELRSIVATADALNLEVIVDQLFGCWYPARTTAILFSEKKSQGTEAA